MASRRGDIMADLLATLEGIQEEYGYRHDVEVVYPYLVAEPSQYPAIMVQETTEEVRDIAYPKMVRFLSLTIYGLNRVRTSLRDRPDIAARDLIADMEQAVLRDPTRGGHAIDTAVAGSEVVMVDDDQVAVSVDVRVQYQTLRTDPTRS